MQRVKAPTPKFFRILRSIGIVLTAASAAVLTAPVTLPAIVLSAAGYLAVAGTVMIAVSQTAVSDENETGNLTANENGGGSTIEPRP